jgi:hypothetical protein
MAYFARLNDENEVIQITSVNNDIIKDSGGEEIEILGIQFLRNLYKEQNSRWVQCSYNTRMGVHINGKTPFRVNYPGIGWTYDPQKDAFIGRKFFESWVLNENTCLYEAPVPIPEGNYPQAAYSWDEATTSWIFKG